MTSVHCKYCPTIPDDNRDVDKGRTFSTGSVVITGFIYVMYAIGAPYILLYVTWLIAVAVSVWLYQYQQQDETPEVLAKVCFEAAKLLAGSFNRDKDALLILEVNPLRADNSQNSIYN